eukprot:631040-Amphidinium_carterae.1
MTFKDSAKSWQEELAELICPVCQELVAPPAYQCKSGRCVAKTPLQGQIPKPPNFKKVSKESENVQKDLFEIWGFGGICPRHGFSQVVALKT